MQSDEQKRFMSFGRLNDLQEAQSSILAVDWRVEPSTQEERNENATLQVFTTILLQYQEQSYLADPYLESLVSPVISWLKAYARDFVLESSSSSSQITQSSARIQRVSALLYHYVKFRGYKAIIRFFPHEVGDLSVVLDYVNISSSLINERTQWALRYLFLIWLSLICMLPFDLAQFDTPPSSTHGKTALLIENLGKTHLSNAGIERDGSALLLSRLYMRKDTTSQLNEFTHWVLADSAQADVFTVIGMLHVLCEITKSAPTSVVQPRVHDLMSIVSTIISEDRIAINTVVRKFCVKLVSRVAIRTLPGIQRKRIVRALNPAHSTIPVADPLAAEYHIDVSDAVEAALERLFTALQDPDTVVRWSAAKGIARITERLPREFVDQVVDTVLHLFTIHSTTAASIYEVPALAESTWHGASLACAELARRGLFHSDKFPALIDWMSKALFFDVRKGAHSIGSNVRDAAAYTIWSLARAQDPGVLSPYTTILSQSLLKATLFDREVQIRRAASAAFQEHVGRTSLFPHGIDVLGKTDFFSVSVRRNAFLVAAPQVAEHEEYRYALLEHLLNVPVRHWDRNMREIAAESVRAISMLDMATLGGDFIRPKMIPLLHSPDPTDIHGAISTLTALGVAYREMLEGSELEDIHSQLFETLSNITYDTIVAPRNGIVTEAICRFISVVITKREIDLGNTSVVPKWRQIIDYGIKHRTAEVQEQGAEALGAVSRLTDCTKTTLRLSKELKSASPFTQQSLGTVLGKLAYRSFPNGLPEALTCILQCVDFSGNVMKNNVEGRRNCYSAIPRIVATLIDDLPAYISAPRIVQLFDALLAGLEDYTIDQRGDVGSWIRIVCVQGLKTCVELLIKHAAILPNFHEYLPPNKYQEAIGGILKQGVEKLDNVRFQAGLSFVELLRLGPPAVAESDRWQMTSPSMLNEWFGKEERGWNDGAWLFPRAVKLLDIPIYRGSVLKGLVLSLSSKTDVTQRNVSESLSQYAAQLPLRSASTYDLSMLLSDLLLLTKGKGGMNAAVIPVLQTWNVLLNARSFAHHGSDEAIVKQLRSVLDLATRGVDRFKNIQRISESMKLVIHLLSFPSVYDQCIEALPSFLGHHYPVIRSDSAEKLFIELQSIDISRDTDEVEEILLGTEWSNLETEASKSAAMRIVGLLKSLA